MAADIETLIPLRAVGDAPFVAAIPGSKSILQPGACCWPRSDRERPESPNALHAQDTECWHLLPGRLRGPVRRKRLRRISACRGSTGASARRPAPIFIPAPGTPARFLIALPPSVCRRNHRNHRHPAPVRTERWVTSWRRWAGPRHRDRKPDSAWAACRHGSPEAKAPAPTGGIDGSVSSQFVSSLLLHAGRRPPGSPPVTVRVPGHLVSRPYVEMTVQIMNRAGVPVEPVGDKAWRVTPAVPTAATIEIEPDASGMSYFLAAAAITGSIRDDPRNRPRVEAGRCRPGRGAGRDGLHRRCRRRRDHPDRPAG